MSSINASDCEIRSKPVFALVGSSGGGWELMVTAMVEIRGSSADSVSFRSQRVARFCVHGGVVWKADVLCQRTWSHHPFWPVYICP